MKTTRADSTVYVRSDEGLLLATLSLDKDGYWEVVHFQGVWREAMLDQLAAILHGLNHWKPKPAPVALRSSLEVNPHQNIP